MSMFFSLVIPANAGIQGTRSVTCPWTPAFAGDEKGIGMGAVDPGLLAAELIRRPSVTPKDEGALEVVARTLEDMGFTCHRLTFEDLAPMATRPTRSPISTRAKVDG
jgi:hypothetical protein